MTTAMGNGLVSCLVQRLSSFMHIMLRPGDAISGSLIILSRIHGQADNSMHLIFDTFVPDF